MTFLLTTLSTAMKLALLAVLALALGASATAKDSGNHVGVGATAIAPLPGDRPIPRVTVSLDDPPATRWNKVMAEGNFNFAPMPVILTPRFAVHRLPPG